MFYEIVSRDSSGFISLDDVKAHLKINNSSSDDLITLYFNSSVEQAEKHLGFPLVPTVLKYYMDTKSEDKLHLVKSAHTITSIEYEIDSVPGTFEGTIRKLHPCPYVDLEDLDSSATNIVATIQAGYASMSLISGNVLSGILHLTGEKWKKRQDPSSSFSTLSDKLFNLEQVISF